MEKTMSKHSALHHLVRKTASGDHEAFEQLFLSHRDIIAFKIRRQISCPEDVEDISQKVAMRVFLKIGSLMRPEAFGSWLDTLVINECNRHFQTTDRTTSLEELPEYENLLIETNADYLPNAHTERVELRTEIWSKLNKMSEKTRDVFIMYYEGGMCYREIAQRLGTTIGNVSSHIFRAKKLLRKELLRA